MKMIQTMKSGSASFAPRPPRPNSETRLTTIAATMTITTSSRKPDARVPASASLTHRSTPSGVTNGRTSAAGALAVHLGRLDLEQRAEHAAIHQDDQHAWHGEGEAEREGKDRHLRVVGEEIGCEARQKTAAAFAIKHTAQHLGGRIRIAPTGQARR